MSGHPDQQPESRRRGRVVPARSFSASRATGHGDPRAAGEGRGLALPLDLSRSLMQTGCQCRRSKATSGVLWYRPGARLRHPAPGRSFDPARRCGVRIHRAQAVAALETPTDAEASANGRLPTPFHVRRAASPLPRLGHRRSSAAHRGGIIPPTRRTASLAACRSSLSQWQPDSARSHVSWRLASCLDAAIASWRIWSQLEPPVM